MSSRFARLIETNLPLAEVAATSSTEAVSLNGADKFSVQVVATVGDSIAHLEGSNSIYPPTDDTEWTEIDDATIAEGATHIFEQPNVAYRWARITSENNDTGDVSSDNFFLVLGDAI